MPIKLPYISLIVFTLLFNPLNAQETAIEIMQKQLSLHKVSSESALDIILLVDRKNNKEKRVQKRYTKKDENGLYKSVNVFTEPATIKGTALLFHENKDSENEQWVYIPAQKKIRKIAAGISRRPYMGTDFIYEDLKENELSDFKYEFLKKENIDEQECFVIEATPISEENKKDSAYSKRILWVRTDIYFTVKIEFYDRKGKLLKTQTNLDIVKVTDSAWRANKAVMENHKKKHKTLFLTKNRKINSTLDNKLFTKHTLTSGELTH